jgi:hypothetical protein
MKYFRRTLVPGSPDEVFSRHMQVGAFERLSPTWQPWIDDVASAVCHLLAGDGVEGAGSAA